MSEWKKDNVPQSMTQKTKDWTTR